MPTLEEIKAELQKRHDAGKAHGDDRLNLDALESIEQLQAENKRLKDLLKDKHTISSEDVEFIIKLPAKILDIQAANRQQAETIEKLRGLLKVAKCADCNGSGIVDVVTDETWERGDGEVFAVTEPAPCQWCYEKEQDIEIPSRNRQSMP